MNPIFSLDDNASAICLNNLSQLAYSSIARTEKIAPTAKFKHTEYKYLLPVWSIATAVGSSRIPGIEHPFPPVGWKLQGSLDVCALIPKT